MENTTFKIIYKDGSSVICRRAASFEWCKWYYKNAKNSEIIDLIELEDVGGDKYGLIR